MTDPDKAFFYHVRGNKNENVMCSQAIVRGAKNNVKFCGISNE